MFNVVIVDDHPVMCSAYRALLESQGLFQVVAMRHTGTSGLAAIREFLPDLVLLDLAIPQLGGIEVITRLRNDSVNVPILVVSGMEDGLNGVRVLRAGANGFLPKTGEHGELITAALMVAKGKAYFSQEVLGAANKNCTAENGLDKLNEKEYEIFRCLANGQSNSEIGAHMLLSSKTVSAYKIKIMRKLGVKNIRELIEIAKQQQVA